MSDTNRAAAAPLATVLRASYLPDRFFHNAENGRKRRFRACFSSLSSSRILSGALAVWTQ